MTSEFVKDAIALIRACRMDSNCPLKNISQDGSVFKFKIQQEELKFDVEIREGQKYPCGTQVTLRSDTGTMTTCFDARLHICAGKVANRLGYTTVPYLNEPPPAPDQTTPKTMTIDDRYIVYLNHPLGQGGFGDVYKGIDTATNTLIAVKIHHQKPKLLEQEAELLCMLTRKGVKGTPQCYWHGFSHGKYCLVMEYLGKNLHKLKLTHRDILMILIKSLSIIEEIHKFGHLHMDLKDLNIMIGKENPNDIYICDFGLAMPIQSADILKPVVCKGYTALYASTNMLQNKVPGRRDDLITLGYAVLQMIRKLPWIGCSNAEQILSEKTKMPTPLLCNGLPVEFALYFKYCNTLDWTIHLTTPFYDNCSSM